MFIYSDKILKRYQHNINDIDAFVKLAKIDSKLSYSKLGGIEPSMVLKAVLDQLEGLEKKDFDFITQAIHLLVHQKFMPEDLNFVRESFHLAEYKDGNKLAAEKAFYKQGKTDTQSYDNGSNLEENSDFLKKEPEEDLVPNYDDIKEIKLHITSDDIVDKVDKIYNYYNVNKYVKTDQERLYKKLDEQDLKDSQYDVSVTDIETTGYLSQSIINNVNIEEPNTVLINIGTGSGKSKAIGHIVSELVKDNKNVVIMASPFRTLVKKDHAYLQRDANISPDLITTIDSLEAAFKKEERYNPKSFTPIQIITVHFLLGNAGDEIFNQARYKTEYLDQLIKYCKQNNKDVYLIFDELHESVDSFMPSQIFYLFKWKDLVKKIIVATATVTDPVSIVLKHLAYLTKDRIKLIRSPRIDNPSIEKSELRIVFTENYSKNDIGGLSIIREAYKQHKEGEVSGAIHTLSFSKEIAKSIEKAGWVNAPYNLLIANSKDTFDNKKNNLGTTFKTGVNTVHGDHLYIILPSSYPEISNTEELGIFSDGISSVIQSISRIRQKGSVTIICKAPPELIEGDYLGILKGLGYKFDISRKTDYKFDLSFLRGEYKSKLSKVKEVANKYESDVNKSHVIRPPINYPSFEDFLVKNGQKYLVSRKLMSGKYIAPYVIWAAFNNQFANCELKTIITVENKFIELDLSDYAPYEVLYDHIYKYYPGNLEQDLLELKERELYENFIATLKEVTIEECKIKVKIIHNGADIPTPNIPLVQLLVVKNVLFMKGYIDVDYVSSQINYVMAQMFSAQRNVEYNDELAKAYRFIYNLSRHITTHVLENHNGLMPKGYDYLGLNIFTEKSIMELKAQIDVIKGNDLLLKRKRRFFENVKFEIENLDELLEHFSKTFINFYLEKGKKKRFTKKYLYKVSALEDPLVAGCKVYF